MSSHRVILSGYQFRSIHDHHSGPYIWNIVAKSCYKIKHKLKIHVHIHKIIKCLSMGSHLQNIKQKILKCCASIYFNKHCLIHNLTHNYSYNENCKWDPIDRNFIILCTCTCILTHILSQNNSQLQCSKCKGLNDGCGLTETSSPIISLQVNTFTKSCV